MPNVWRYRVFFTLRSHLKFYKQKKTRNKARAGEKQKKTGNEEREQQKVPSGVFACYKQTLSGVLRLSKHQQRGDTH